MKKASLKSLPLEFQKINKLIKEKNEIPQTKTLIEVSFFKCKKVNPEIFFKPISKIVNFDV